MQDDLGTESMRVEAGMAFDRIEARLGAPAAVKRLNSDRPSVMGARVVSYLRAEPPIVFQMADGQQRAGRRLDLVLDPQDRVLRLVDNPNPLPGEDGRAPVQRGRPGEVVAALVPL